MTEERPASERVNQGVLRSVDDSSMYHMRVATKTTPETQYHEGDFKKLAAKLKAKSGKDSNALAAYVMRRKYGAKGWKHTMAKGRKAAAAKGK